MEIREIERGPRPAVAEAARALPESNKPGTAALPPGPLQRQPRGQLRTLRGSYIASAILAVPDLIRTRALVCFEPHLSRGVTDAQP